VVFCLTEVLLIWILTTNFVDQRFYSFTRICHVTSVDCARKPFSRPGVYVTVLLRSACDGEDGGEAAGLGSTFNDVEYGYVLYL